MFDNIITLFQGETLHITLFAVFSQAAMIGWLLLVLVPNWKTGEVISKTLIPLFIAIGYSVLFLPEYWAREAGGYDTLGQVEELMNLGPRVLLAAWIHYLAFDLLIGHWIAADARSKGIYRIFTIIPLFCTLMFGPFGWLLYQVVAKVHDMRSKQVSRA